MQIVKIRGSQGSWEAQVSYPDGRKEVLACVHQHFWKSGPSGPCYDDPWTPELRETAKFAKHVDLIRTKGRVILTTDNINESKNRGEGFFERTGYVAVYNIDDLVVDDEGLRFRFADRIANAK
jgi:hypothetical protein